MYGGPPEQSPAEIKARAQELEASTTIQFTLTTCVLLYLSPFAVDYVQKLF
ncbi:hypothetical protein BT63DRAFT_476863 [Microthyrium microscopicum]|uniref:Mitochondrial outer membrane translocase complex, subunit Tom5 n=1 Tax=Microthyrium microscopicum TaxID=703497 RepID=A0A6A6UJV7_9PEZI|nr:hypothetical protein BT63DRAFT_476863 [Microthyrium microscopicum]